MQEAFRRALDQLDHDRAQPHLEARNLKVLQLATRGDSAPAPSTRHGADTKLVYSARRLGRRWCCYARPGGDSPTLLDTLRDDWVVFARQLVALPQRERALLLWELASAMRPDDSRHDVDRGRYLVRRALAHPELFAGLTSCPWIPWPGPASYLVHAVAELEGASAREREALHQSLRESLHENTENGAFWLVRVLADWLHARYEGADG